MMLRPKRRLAVRLRPKKGKLARSRLKKLAAKSGFDRYFS
jgi:hypothetical protein